MAEMLVFAQEVPEVEEGPGKWKRGMAVAIKPDGHEWGRKEKPPKFNIIKFPGLSVDALKEYVESETEDKNGNIRELVNRRKFKLDIDSFPTDKKNKLGRAQGIVVDKDDTGKSDMDLKVIRAAFKVNPRPVIKQVDEVIPRA